MEYATIMLSMFCRVFLQSFQQLNVVHHHPWLAFATAQAMAAAEWATVGVIAASTVASGLDAYLIAPMGIGGGLGVVAGMAIHRRVRG